MRASFLIFMLVSLLLVTAFSTQPSAPVAIAQSGRSCTKPAYFLIQVQDEKFVLAITDPPAIRDAMDTMARHKQLFPMGEIAIGDGGFNTGYSWHLVPESVRMVEAAMEVCDGLPSQVENITSKVYCPWSARVLKRLPDTNNNQNQTIEASGCVRRGVEAGCLVLKDFEGKEEYSLFFPTKKEPNPDTAISLEGTRHKGGTRCKRGTLVDVNRWTTLKRLCPKESKERPMATEEKILVEVLNVTVEKIRGNLFRITARGNVRTSGWVVNLHPWIYIRPPENWDIDAVGIKPTGVVMEVITPWEASIEMNLPRDTRHITVHGVSLKGENQAITREVPW